MEKQHVTDKEFQDINQWGKDVGNLKVSFCNLYPKVALNGQCSPSDVLGNLQQLHVQKTTTRHDALEWVTQQAHYYAERKSAMFRFVEEHESDYKKYKVDNHPSSWLGQKMGKFEEDLRTLIATLQRPPVQH